LHISYVHPKNFEQHVKKHKDDKEAKQQSTLFNAGSAPKFTDSKRERLHRRLAHWCASRDMADSTCERHTELREAFEDATSGAYLPPDHHQVRNQQIYMGSKGLELVNEVNKQLEEDDISPSISGDIWSDQTISLLGITEYFINREWEFCELLVSAEPFSKERHTGDKIDEKSVAALAEAGIPIKDGTDIDYGAVWLALSDNGSNMKKGWRGFDQGFCAAHGTEREVLKLYTRAGVKELIAKPKGISTHFHHSPHTAIPQLHKEQRSAELRESRPPNTGNSIRWHFTHDQLEWFRDNQKRMHPS
jgi:hypothetical protein